jgi:MraW methylase family
VLTRKPEIADEDETDRNPRARSAKLRAAEMLIPGSSEKQKPEYRDTGSGRQLTGFAQLAKKKKEKQPQTKQHGTQHKHKKRRLRD